MVDVLDYAINKNKIEQKIPQAIDSWLEDHIDPDSGYALDNTLQSAEAAAPAKTVGDAIGELKSALTYDSENIDSIYDFIGGEFARAFFGYEHTMLNGSGVEQTESATLKFWKFDVENCKIFRAVFKSSPSGSTAHWINEIAEDGTVLHYESQNTSIGADKYFEIVCQSTTKYVVISVWTANESVKVLANVRYANNSVNTDIDYLDEITTSLVKQNDGSYPLKFDRTFTIVKTNGDSTTEKEQVTNQVKFFECKNLYGATSIKFKLSSPVASGKNVHWFNQFDANDNLLSYASFDFTVGTSEYTATLENGCVRVKVSMFYEQVPFEATVNIVKSPMFSKVSGLGDSITAGYSQYETVTNTYQKLIANTLGASYQNLGISSTPVCPNSDYTEGQNDNAFVYRYGSIAADADLIIIAGGTNDFRHNVPLGTASDTDAKYEETFYGACDYLLKNIFANHVNAKIVWVSPFHQMWDNTTNTIGLTLEQYLEAIKVKCRKYGVTYIDAYACSGMNMSSACITAFMPDSIHPNTAGHLLIYKNLMPYFAMS